MSYLESGGFARLRALEARELHSQEIAESPFDLTLLCAGSLVGEAEKNLYNDLTEYFHELEVGNL